MSQAESKPPVIVRIAGPFREFIHIEASGGIVLIAATLVALLWANSPWSARYFDLWDTTLTIGIGDYALSKALQLWINDGLMAIFFFVVGLEIKRELLLGELASPRQALLPVAAAAGGALLPALIFLALSGGGDASRGWAVPMATDIAFSLGLLALVGSRAPLGLKIFLTAFAIIDDLIAVLVIALFYTAELRFEYFGLAGAVLLLLIAANRAHVIRPAVYAVLGIVLWFALLKSGVHATIAGVLLAMTIPARTRIDGARFLEMVRDNIERFRGAGVPGPGMLPNHAQISALHRIDVATEHVVSPMQRLEHGLHPWVAFAIVPVFAVANAGVDLRAGLSDALTSSLTLGIVAGLLLGKQVGILGATWLVVRSGWSALPDGVSWRQIYGVSWLAGIGFTMSLFVAGLAYDDAALLEEAKIGILAASLITGTGGFLLLRFFTRPGRDLDDDEPLVDVDDEAVVRSARRAVVRA